MFTGQDNHKDPDAENNGGDAMTVIQGAVRLLRTPGPLLPPPFLPLAPIISTSAANRASALESTSFTGLSTQTSDGGIDEVRPSRSPCLEPYLQQSCPCGLYKS